MSTLPVIGGDRTLEQMFADTLERYRVATGVELEEEDPRRKHLQAMLRLLDAVRQRVSLAGLKGLLRHTTDEVIPYHAEIYAAAADEAEGSGVTLRFTSTIAIGASQRATIAAGKRASNGTFAWAVQATTEGEIGAQYVDALAICTTAGAATNGVEAGQITELVDSVPRMTVSNISTSQGGSDAEAFEDFQERLRDEPENRSLAGPSLAYERLALDADSNIFDAVALGPDDATQMSDLGGATRPKPNPGEVHLVVAADGDAATVAAALAAAEAACDGDESRPRTDDLSVLEPLEVEFDIVVTWWLAESRADELSTIQDAVELAFEQYKLWQTRKIGRDINPSELIARLVVAGAKRVSVSAPTFDALFRDEIAVLGYEFLGFGGIEAD